MEQSFQKTLRHLKRIRDRFPDFLEKGGPLVTLMIVEEKGRLQRIPEVGKSNERAVEYRNAGNGLYAEGKYERALECYNKSLAFAEPDTDQLGMAYANRSAVQLKQGEYEFALYSIELAKKHNYPEELMPKLLERESECKQQIVRGNSKGTVPCPRMGINVDTNPKIPFLARGIAMSHDAKFGRGLVAEREFKPGDIICDEKCELCDVDYNLIYRNCNQCGGDFANILIPCPKCPFFMYCSEECLELSWKLYHRFECAVATKLYVVSQISKMVHARMFFYGLTQFEDNLQAMMDYCVPEVTTVANPLAQDFNNLNRLDVFKAYHNTKPYLDPELEIVNMFGACVYYVLLLTNPALSSLVNTEPFKWFFFTSLLKYHRMSISLVSVSITGDEDHVVGFLSPVNSICNHSCDPNAVGILHSGRYKIALIRPVRKGEPIFCYYSPPWWDPERSPVPTLHFPCECVVCDRGPAGKAWRLLKKRPFPAAAVKNVRMMQDMVCGETTSNANKLNMLQQFIRRFSELHPNKIVGQWLDWYSYYLTISVYAENLVLLRAKVQEMRAEH
uniref:SET and MYND domain-containing protein 4 n=1 Tax=Culex pipiens TaxID=7175 RepID=A0A8D8G2T2_CULPI